MNLQLQIIKGATKRGWQPARLSGSQIEELRSEAMTSTQKVRAAGRVASSVVRTRVLGRVVPLHVAQANEATCRGNPCGSFQETTSGEPVCMRCACYGRLLEVKWDDPKQRCPVEPHEGGPYWDNTKVQEEAP